MGRLLHFCLCEFLAKLCASCKNIIVFFVYVVSGFQLLDFTRHPLSWTSLVCTTHDLGLDNDKHLCPSHLFQSREGGPKQVLSLFLVDTNFFCSSASFEVNVHIRRPQIMKKPAKSKRRRTLVIC